MRKDFSPSVLKQGKALFDKGGCFGARLASYTAEQIVIEAKVVGHFEDVHKCSVEISRADSELLYSTCDCVQEIDCFHLACLMFFLEKHFHTMLLTFLGKAQAGDESVAVDVDAQEIKKVEKKLQKKAQKESDRQLIADYSKAGQWLATSSLFRPAKETVEKAELMLLVGTINAYNRKFTEIQLAVRLLGRPKPVLIQQPRIFLLALQQLEPLVLGNQRVVLSDESFGEMCCELIIFLRREFEYYEKADKVTRGAFLQLPRLFSLLGLVAQCRKATIEEERLSLFHGNFDTPLEFSATPVQPCFSVEKIDDPDTRLVVRAFFEIPEKRVSLRDVRLILSTPPGVLVENTFYPLAEPVTIRNAMDLDAVDLHVVPKALFSSFVSYALPNLQRFGKVRLAEGIIDKKKGNYLEEPKAICHADLKDGELSVRIAYQYGEVQVPEIRLEHTLGQISTLISSEQEIPRNLMQETQLSQEILWGLVPSEKEGLYSTKSEKRIIEFVTETLPMMEERVEYYLTPSMERCFSFEASEIELSISETENRGTVRCQLTCKGPLQGVAVSKVLEAARLRRSYIETARSELGIFPKKVIVSTPEEIEALAHVVEDFSIPSFKKGSWALPLWSVIGAEDGATFSSQVRIRCTKGIKELRNSLSDPKCETESTSKVFSLLHPYQKDGVQWLKRLREFGLAGILADDMGIGKTVQAICALSEVHKSKTKTGPSLIVCPTSLVDNWYEELHRFEPSLKVVTFVGAPGERRKLFSKKGDVDVYVTSYGLIQRDLELFESITFSYVILDEAQAIKNRETRNARSVKKLNANNRLVLTGTPIENSLDDLWSIFDFLMPGFLGSHERFSQMYMRANSLDMEKTLEFLKKRIAPFVLRRMKQDVLEDLPSITHSIYHCYLHDEQRKIYQKAATKAREELQDLVEKKGFDKARLHVLATLTKLKQICCHPSLVEDRKDIQSAKYEMLKDLIRGLLDTKHKTVLFSQYTRMLKIIRDDLDKEGIPYLYLDGATKNRQSLVRQFNKDEKIPLFLISLRAGGQGLNLVGADSVIHYDMWWNPAVENQATDRVWRMGQKTKVNSYKLVTKGTIEEKILDLQNRKKDLISDLVECDDDVLSKLTWEDVLNLLRT